MINLQNDLPEDPRGQSLPLMRCPANKPLTGIILSDDLLGTPTHFFHGRTIPCDDETCPACEEGVPWRWHVYLALWGVSSHRTILFETTAKAAEPLITYRKAYGTLRGCLLTAKRANTAANSRVIIQTSQADLQKMPIPDAPNVIAALSIIWNIEQPSISVGGRLRNAAKLSVRQNLDLRRDRLSSLKKTHQSSSPNGNGCSTE